MLLADVTIQTLLNYYPAGLSTGFSVLRWGLRWKLYSSACGMNPKRNEHRSPLATNRTGRKRSTCTKSFLDPQHLDILGQIISSRFSDFHGHPTGAPNEQKQEKRFECSFLLSHIVLWSFKGIFLRANTILSVRMW